MLAGIVVGCTHLLVKSILHEHPERQYLLALETLFLRGFDGGFLGPLGEFCSTIEVTIVAEGCIGLQPMLVVFAELLEGCPTAHRFPFLVEQQVQIFHLRLEHAFIVYLRQCVQLFLQFLEFLL